MAEIISSTDNSGLFLILIYGQLVSRAMCAVLEEGSGFKCNDGDPFGRREWEGTKQDLCPRTALGGLWQSLQVGSSSDNPHYPWAEDLGMGRKMKSDLQVAPCATSS